MKIKLCFISLIIWAVAATVAAQSPVLEVDNMGGMNNGTNTLNLRQGEAETSRNWDYSVSTGDIVKRRGFSIFTEGFAGIAQKGRYTGIKSFVDHGGDIRFFGAFNHDDTVGNYPPYQWLVKSNLNAGRMEGAILYKYQYWRSTPQWATFNQPKRNVLIYANGYNRPLRWNETGMEPLVEVAPGSYDFAPMPETASTTQLLDGDYYYAIRPAIPCSTGAATAWRVLPDSLNMVNLSWRIHVDSDWVQIFGRQDFDTTAICDPDSTIIQIGRTRNGAEPHDSFFFVTEFRYENTDIFDYKTFIDTVVDDSFNVTEFWDGDVGFPDTGDCTGACDSTHVNYPFIGLWDSSSAEYTASKIIADLTLDSNYILGAPMFLGRDSCGGCGFAGIMAGKSDSTVTSLRYFLSFYDSSTQMLSEPGPVTRISTYVSSNGLADSILQLHIPRTPSYANHLWKILFRAEDATTTDTIKLRTVTAVDYAALGAILGAPYCLGEDQLYFADGFFRCRGNRWEESDSTRTSTTTSPYYPIDTFRNVAGTTYNDVKSLASINGQRTHPLTNITLGQARNPIVYNNRLMFSIGNDIVFSSVTTQGALIGRFDAGNRITIDPSGNDEVTALHTSGNFLNVFKNRSWFRVQEIDFENFVISKQEVFPGIGCIAPHSVIDLPGGGMAWLSLNGIHAFSTHLQSIFKETTGDLALISTPIQNHLDKYRIKDLQKCHAWLDDGQRNLIFSFPTLDTSYVISLTTGQWTQWTFSPLQTTGNADTSYTDLIEPSNDIIFVMQDLELVDDERVGYPDTFALASNDDIYKWGDSAGVTKRLDVADTVEAFWKSGILGKNIDVGEFDHFGLWRESNDTGHVTVTLYDENNTSFASFIIDSLEKRFTLGHTPLGEGHGFQVELKTEADSIAIQGFVLKYINKGSAKITKE